MKFGKRHCLKFEEYCHFRHHLLTENDFFYLEVYFRNICIFKYSCRPTSHITVFDITVTDIEKVNILWHGKGPKAGTCECGNGPSGSIKCGEFLD